MGKSWLLAFWNFFKQQESLKKKIETFFTQIVRNYFKNISNGHISGMMVYNTEYQTFEIVEKEWNSMWRTPKEPTYCKYASRLPAKQEQAKYEANSQCTVCARIEHPLSIH